MSQNFSKQTCDVCCIHCEESHYLKETMDEFIPVSPNGKLALCIEDLRKFSVKELQGKLKHYHENISEKKNRPSDENLCHFLSLPTKVTVSTVAIRFINGSYYLLHLKSCFFS